MEKVIELKKVNKSYDTQLGELKVLTDISYSFEKGKMYAIRGHSGSGKSTLVKCLGLMDTFDSGEYFIYDHSTNNINDVEASFYRMKHIGFVFQDFNLNPFLTACENIIVPMIINKSIPQKIRQEKAEELLKKVGMLERKEHFPKELSGGEQQRVAIARALANDPDIIIADEPSGNLDKHNEETIFKLFKNMANEGKCIIIVSHSYEISKYADVNLLLEDNSLREVKI